MSQSDSTDDSFEMPPTEPPIGVCRKAFGVPCTDISGYRKMMLIHPSKPSKRLIQCGDVLKEIKKLGFRENIESGTLGTMHFSYIRPCPHGHAADAGLCPTPKLPRAQINGLHPFTYKALLDALNHYLQKERTQEIYILRFVPVDPVADTAWDYDFGTWRVWYVAELRGVSFVYSKNYLDIEDYVRYNQMFDYDL